MITRKEVEAQDKLARAEMRGAQAKEKYYAALLEVVAPIGGSSGRAKKTNRTGDASQKGGKKKE